MTAEDAISTEGKHGAGLYGAPPPSHKTKCPHSNNPHGHSKECRCGHVTARASQIIPYADHPYEHCDATCRECNEQSWWHLERANKSRERNR